ncbi:galactofuranosyltransferase [Lactiplantibacillus pentosus]|uniref:galactofuranosyltransferase n=1 Tax=Lactiplantibacillus pentosus TaxID=1589 RepID=UPI003C16FEBA
MNKYVTNFFYGGPSEKNAGPKAKSDVNLFLNEDDFKNVDIHLEYKKIVKLFLTDYQLKKQIDLNNKGIFILQYPLDSKLISNRIKKMINDNDKFTSVCLIHDLKGLRVEDIDEESKIKEIDYLNSFDYLIVHNQSMKNWLLNRGISVKMFILNLFDYNNPCEISDSYEYDIVYAGNLIKANFLKELKLNSHKLNVCGVNELDHYPDNIIYNGSYYPEELPRYLNAKFGLVWDGDSIKNCSGNYGHYLKYNTPHKISLYLSSGIPVIVWKDSAMSEYIVNNNFGISVDSLESIDEILDSISIKEYQSMKDSVLEVANKLRRGFFIKSTLNNIMEKQKNNF